MQRETFVGDVVPLEEIDDTETGFGLLPESHVIDDVIQNLEVQVPGEEKGISVFHGGAILRGALVGKRVRVTVEVLGESPPRESGERPDMEEVNERE